MTAGVNHGELPRVCLEFHLNTLAIYIYTKLRRTLFIQPSCSPPLELAQTFPQSNPHIRLYTLITTLDEPCVR
jgi:hypothetical protein